MSNVARELIKEFTRRRDTCAAYEAAILSEELNVAKAEYHHGGKEAFQVAIDAVQRLRDSISRADLVCTTCNDHHDEDSICGVCHETALQIEREKHESPG